MSDSSTRRSSRSTTPVLSKTDQAAQEEQLRQFKEAATRGATKTPIPPEDLSVELSALRAQLTSEDGAAQDLQERLDRLEAERQVAVLRAQLQERNRTTQALRDRLQQADHHNQATAFRTAHNAALTARVSFDADSSRNPRPHLCLRRPARKLTPHTPAWTRSPLSRQLRGRHPPERRPRPK